MMQTSTDGEERSDEPGEGKISDFGAALDSEVITFARDSEEGYNTHTYCCHGKEE